MSLMIYQHGYGSIPGRTSAYAAELPYAGWGCGDRDLLPLLKAHMYNLSRADGQLDMQMT